MKFLASSENPERLARLLGRVAHFDEMGEPFVRLRLSCSDTDNLALVWRGQTELPENMGHLSLVEIQGMQVGGTDPWILVEKIDLADRQVLEQSPFLHSLPRCYCPQPVFSLGLRLDCRLYPLTGG